MNTRGLARADGNARPPAGGGNATCAADTPRRAETATISTRAQRLRPTIQLARAIELHRGDWPADLINKAELALLSMRLLEINKPHAIEAVKKNAPETWASITKHLSDFAESYAAHEARG